MEQNKGPASGTPQSTTKPQQGGLSWSTPAPKSAAPTTAQKSLPANTASTPREIGSGPKYVGFVAGGVIVGMFLAWGVSALRAPKAAETTATNNMPATAASSDNETSGGVDVSSATLGGLSIATPQAPGLSVAISAIAVSAPTWVVVYDDNNGTRGNALGATLFFPGTTSGKVELLRATVSGKSYLAVKQLDNGDKRFSINNDTYVTEGGVVQWVKFDVK